MLLIREISCRELPLHQNPPSIGLSAMNNRVNGVNEECLPSVAHFYVEAAQRVVGDCLQTGMKSSKQVVGNRSNPLVTVTKQQQGDICDAANLLEIQCFNHLSL